MIVRDYQFTRPDPAMVVRGWINFSGFVPTILGHNNVSSLTRASTGKYTVTWATAMVASAYAQVIGGMVEDSTAGTGAFVSLNKDTAEPATPTSLALLTEFGTADGVVDLSIITVAVMGPQ